MATGSAIFFEDRRSGLVAFWLYGNTLWLSKYLTGSMRLVTSSYLDTVIAHFSKSVAPWILFQAMFISAQNVFIRYLYPCHLHHYCHCQTVFYRSFLFTSRWALTACSIRFIGFAISGSTSTGCFQFVSRALCCVYTINRHTLYISVPHHKPECTLKKRVFDAFHAWHSSSRHGGLAKSWESVCSIQNRICLSLKCTQSISSDIKHRCPIKRTAPSCNFCMPKCIFKETEELNGKTINLVVVLWWVWISLYEALNGGT